MIFELVGRAIFLLDIVEKRAVLDRGKHGSRRGRRYIAFTS